MRVGSAAASCFVFRNPKFSSSSDPLFPASWYHTVIQISLSCHARLWAGRTKAAVNLFLLRYGYLLIVFEREILPGFSQTKKYISRNVSKLGEGFGKHSTIFVIFHSDCSVLSKESSISLYWSYLHSLWRRLTWFVEADFLVTWYCIFSQLLTLTLSCRLTCNACL